MSRVQKRIMLLDVAALPFIPFLYLYNQNFQFLSFAQVMIAGVLLAAVTLGIFFLNVALFRSYSGSFFASVVFVALVFFTSSVFSKLELFWVYLIFALPIPAAYIAGFLYRKWFQKREWSALPVLASVALATMLLFNLVPIATRGGGSDANAGHKYKTEFVVNDKSDAPNVYWFLCDGMLGFDAMERYFGDDQQAFSDALAERGFAINREATFESGHWTRISIPVLMCPQYYDTYLGRVVADHAAAVALREITGTGLDNARKNNETILAFDAKGYTTTTISIEGPYFYPTTDYFYRIEARFENEKDERTSPRLTQNIDSASHAFNEGRLYAYQLGELFLGGIPGQVYDLLFPSKTEVERELATQFDGASDVLLGSSDALINTALVESLYDAVHTSEIAAPKFVIVHDFLAHYPFDTDENGNRSAEPEDILSYGAHHTYAAKVLINLIDMVQQADPNAVIVLQADHGLHEMKEEQITEAFGEDAVLDIWNSTISAICVPEAYRNGEEPYALATPLNMARYLVNNFVGENYAYLRD